MPKILEGFEYTKEMKQNRSSQNKNNIDTEKAFAKVSVGGDTLIARIIGRPLEFIAHWPRVYKGKDEDGKVKYENKNFPDDEERNGKPVRICGDPTPISERKKDMKTYVSNTVCPWCKLRFQGFLGSERYLINIIDRSDGLAKMLEIPPSAYQELCRITEEYKKLMPKGPGNVNGKVYDVKFQSIPGKNGFPEWKVEFVTVDLDDPEGKTLKELSEEDINALKAINPNATTEEEQLRGYDLPMWKRVDHMSEEVQTKIFKEVKFEVYQPSNESKETVEDFENEIDEAIKQESDEEWDVDKDIDEDVSTETEEDNPFDEDTSDDEDFNVWDEDNDESDDDNGSNDDDDDEDDEDFDSW